VMLVRSWVFVDLLYRNWKLEVRGESKYQQVMKASTLTMNCLANRRSNIVTLAPQSTNTIGAGMQSSRARSTWVCSCILVCRACGMHGHRVQSGRVMLF
jgi:hypothetical protein